jgi:hypothetical protein
MRQLQRTGPPIQTPPPVSSTPAPGQSQRAAELNALISPEAFQARALNMGPPRRVFVELGSSMVRSPDAVLRGGVVRDSIIRRLGASGRFRPIPTDSAQMALAKTRTFDTLAAMLNVDLFVTLRSSPSRADSVHWQVEARDLSAHPQYLSRTVTGLSGPIADGMDMNITRFVDLLVRQLAEIDRAPRKPVAAGQGR